MYDYNFKRTSSTVVWNMFLRLRCEDCHYVQLVTFSWPLLRILVSAAFVHPAFIRPRMLFSVCQTELWCAAHGIKRQPCWLMICHPMSPFGNGYCVSHTCHLAPQVEEKGMCIMNIHW